MNWFRSILQGFETEVWNVQCCCQHSLAQSFDRTCTYILPSSNSGIMLLTQLIFIVTLLHMCEINIKKDYYLFRWHINVTGTNWIYLQLTTAIYMQNFKSIINNLYECIYIYMHFYKVFTCLFVLFYCGNKWGKYVYNMPWNNKQNGCLKNCFYLFYHLFLTHHF